MSVVSQITGTGVVLAILLINGCTHPPTTQLEAAQKAIDAVKAAEAETYAKDDLVKLEQEFALAKDELAKQETVFSIFRSYDDVDEMLSKVVEYGGHVAAKASQNKEAAKTAALAMEQEAHRVVASAKDLMAKAPIGKERAAVETIKQDLTGLEADLALMHELIQKGNYLAAEVQAGTLKKKGAAVSGEIQSAIEKTRRKPRAHA
ncbi:MAG TPA: hypothetical protein VLE46_10245 [Nitrospira sp.]|nr:hypothetical protein [Nitrospira sp.]